MECIQIIIHGYLFLCVKLCKFNVLHNPSSSNIMIGPTMALGVIFSPNILRENIPFIQKIFFIHP